MNEFMVPVAAILATFIFPVIMVILIIWFKTNAKNKQDKLRAELIAKAIEHGQTIPDNLFEETKEKKNLLQKGIIWTAVGLGISLFFLANTGGKIDESVGLGFIPMFVGLGFLFIHFFDKKQEKKEEK